MRSIDEARATVIKMLTEGMKVPVTIRDDGGVVARVKGQSTAAFFHFREQTFDGTAPTQSFVSISAPLLRNVPESPELYKWIALHSTGFRLGSIEVLPEGDGRLFLLYRHTLLVDYRSEEHTS